LCNTHNGKKIREIRTSKATLKKNERNSLVEAVIILCRVWYDWAKVVVNAVGQMFFVAVE